MPEKSRTGWTVCILPGLLALCGLAVIVSLCRGAARDYAARAAEQAATTAPGAADTESPHDDAATTPAATLTPAEAWTGRAFGLAMGAVALGVAAVMIGGRRKGSRPYWRMVGGLAFAALAAGAYSYRPAAPKTAAARDIPLQIGEWRGEELGVDETTKEVLGTDDIIMRAYSRPTGEPGAFDRVVLAVIFARGKRKVAHPPEQCYAGQGFEMLLIEPDTFETDQRPVNVQHLLISKGHAQQVIYWYKAGDLNTPNFLAMQFKVILSSLLMEPPLRVGLIRLSSTIRPDRGGPEHALKAVKDFAAEIFPEIEKRLNPAPPKAGPFTPEPSSR
jgi:EpsI family protein